MVCQGPVGLGPVVSAKVSSGPVRMGEVRSAMAWFLKTSCSQCGQEFPGGPHGFSFCIDHSDLLPIKSSGELQWDLDRLPEAGHSPEDVDVIVLVKGDERYVLMYTASNRGEALKTLSRWACNPELTFTWHDAAVLSQKIRQRIGAME